MRQAIFKRKTFPDLMKDINPQIHEALEKSVRINKNKFAFRQIIMKLQTINNHKKHASNCSSLFER